MTRLPQMNASTQTGNLHNDPDANLIAVVRKSLRQKKSSKGSLKNGLYSTDPFTTKPKRSKKKTINDYRPIRQSYKLLDSQQLTISSAEEPLNFDSV
jgi:hypothetical protein